ncbi:MULTISPECIES: VOC family protein [Sphingobium]|uniref:VOC family protein n=1 Tax=Sphingobium TaxID=165695 RepID=UPI000A929BB7|nr:MULTISPECIES: VOC family protein [Sphingobium]
MSVEVQPRAVSPHKLAHVVLNTRDNFTAMMDWYQTVLNARRIGEYAVGPGNMGLLTYDEEHHRIAIVSGPHYQPAGEGPRVGLEHIAFTYSDAADLLHTYARLKQQDAIEPTISVNHGPTTSLYYRDPEGNRVELLVDNLGMEEAIQFAHDVFDVNAIGTLYDPQAAYDALIAGADPATLSVCPDVSEVRPPDPAFLAILATAG